MVPSACCQAPEPTLTIDWQLPEEIAPPGSPQEFSAGDSDHVLIEASQKGFRQAFDWLVVRYQARILNAVAAYMRDRDAVVDVAQETFIRAYKGIKRFRYDSHFYTWLYRIAINTAYIYLNKEHKKHAVLDSDSSEMTMAAISDDTIYEPDQQRHTEELQHHLQSAIEELPTEQRTAFLLLENDGLHYADIAEVTNAPIGTVRSRIFRARETLANRLAEFY
ncbi:sigma-70 family RNA polymerase sigma factor [Hahella ganghwensis]|uniref:sigma-70 family RNA polymerase sigma factor n=1 Tax=Hahella ganghwensis TaxID=286420 RepID=UPI000380B50B|nr:sigma-70 family RNA polymerase sigma factor [Hahella ganghwensis]